MRLPWYLMAKGKGGGGYKTASGPIVSVNDALAAPLRSLVASIEPVQEGSGDPSPDNVRPISGWSEVNVTRTGKNLLPIQTFIKSGGSYFIGDNSTYFQFKAGTYTASNVGTAAYMYWRKKGTTDNNIIHMAAAKSGTFTLTEDCEIRFWFYTTVADPSFTDIQIELGSTATAYEPYSGNQYTIQLGQTVYGGTLDVTGGVLTVDRANIPSYNGETLPGEWISDRDVYAPGTTPTIGAQVVYELATPITIPLTPTQISTLQGANNVWADTGDVTIEYLASGGANADLMKLAVAFMGRK